MPDKLRKSERELLQEYDGIRTQMVQLLDTAQNEERALYETDDDGRTNERAVFEELEERGKVLLKRINQEKALRALELGLPGSSPEDVPEGTVPVEAINDGGERAMGSEPVLAEERMKAFRSYIHTGRDLEYRSAMRSIEERAGATNPMIVGDDTQGGFVTAPPEYVPEIIADLDSVVTMRKIATVRQIGKAESLGFPKMTSKMSGAVHGTEVGDIPEMTQPKFGRREWFPRPITGWFAVSNTLLRKSAVPAEQLIRSEIQRVVGEQEETDFCTGSGAPGISMGAFTASPMGISTDRDFATGNDPTQIKLDGLKRAKWGLKQGYWPFAKWLFTTSALEQIDLLKYADGRPVWNESVRDKDGNPMLLGFPVAISDFVPAVFTSGLYVGALGDWRQYLIAESLQIEIKRLNELKALNDLTVFLVRVEVDGMPKLEEAFCRVKLG